MTNDGIWEGKGGWLSAIFECQNLPGSTQLVPLYTLQIARCCCSSLLTQLILALFFRLFFLVYCVLFSKMNSKKFNISNLLAPSPPMTPPPTLEPEEPQLNGLEFSPPPMHQAKRVLFAPPSNPETSGYGENQIGHGRKRTMAKVYRDNKSGKKEQADSATVVANGNNSSGGHQLDTTIFDGPYYHCLDAKEASPKQYKGYRLLCNFEFDEIYKSSYPEEELKALFASMLQHVQNGAAEKGLHPNYHMISINSKHLDYDIFINIQQLNDNTPQEILNTFERHDQSNRAKQRESVITDQFQLDIIAIELKNPNNRKRKRKGAGGGYKIRLQPLHFKINKGGLFEINNTDRFCLFRALTMAFYHQIMKPERFSEYRRDEALQLSGVLQLLEHCRIPANRLFYTIEDFGDICQNYFDRQFPQRFKIFAFENQGQFRRPFWKSNSLEYTDAISIYYWHEEGHYDAIKSVGQLFSVTAKNRYCFACEMPYQIGYKHSSVCKSKCQLCTRVGQEFPCKADGFRQFCAGCSKMFTNRLCFEYHHGKNICQKSKRCHECEVIYRTEHFSKLHHGHRCGWKYCKRCLGYHTKRSCYMQPFKIRKAKDERIIIMDSESTTHFQADPRIMKFAHQTNFIFALVCCTRCISNGTWQEPLKRACRICGEHRRYAWAPFDFEGTDVDVFTLTDDPMGDFVDWAIHFEQQELGQAENGELEELMGIAVDQDRHHDESSSDEEEEEEESQSNEDADENDEDTEGVMDGIEDETETERQNRRVVELLTNAAAEGIEEDEDGKKEKEQKSFRTLVYAHAGSRYDHIFCFGKILEREHIVPKLIRNGNRLYEMKIEGKGLTRTVFRDSYHIIPIKLAKFTDTFGLNIPSKSHFPHHFNRPENYDITLDGLPPKDDYGPGSMAPEDKVEFESWYAENVKKISFNLNNTIADYCSNDVILLANGLIKMRELFQLVTGQNIFHSVTLASACVKVFRTFLEPNQLALTPHMGYENHGSQSVLGRKYLKWYEKLNGVKVRSAESAEGELRYKNYLLDGFVQRPDHQKDLVIEIHGCFWHACPACHPDDDTILAGGIPAGTIRQRNLERMNTLLEMFEVKVVWECQINAMLEREKIVEIKQDGSTTITTMRSFFEELPDTGLIQLNDAFFGGRTGPEVMAATTQGRPGKVIKYRDFKSLYPSMNWNTNYPVGHPTIKEFNKDVEWCKAEDIKDENGNQMQGIVKCFVVPPRHPHCDIPVLPMRINKSLVFATCATCAKKMTGNCSRRKPNYQCKHFKDSERGFSTTMTTMELEMALEAGYRVTRLYRAYDWELMSDWDNSLFHPYMKLFMRLKYEAEGWPKSCTEDGLTEEEKEERKRKHVEEANKRFGFGLKAENIHFNPGLRFIAKLCLNSLWGRFALRNRLSVSVICNNDEDIARYLWDDKIEINLFEQLDERNTLICYKTKDEHIKEHDSSNIVVALWTTSAARIHLLKHLYHVIQGRDDTRLLYMDTDSILYEFSAEKGDPLEKHSGDQLGALADEYPNHTIVEVIITAPKAYALWLKHNATGEDKFVWRMKGIPLTADVKDQLRYERYKEMALKWGEVPEEEVSETFTLTKNFRIERAGRINTVHMEKRLRPVINKGVVLHPSRIVHYGWSDPLWCSQNNPYDCNCKGGVYDLVYIGDQNL